MRGLATGLLIVLVSADARADRSSMGEAKRLAASAQLHFDLGDYTRAIHEYGAAYELEPRPGFLYNLGQSYRLDGDCKTARRMYQNYLRLSPTTPYRAMVERHLTSLDRCVRTKQRKQQIAAAVTATGIAVAGLGLWMDRPELSTGMIAGGLVAAVSGATFALTWEW